MESELNGVTGGGERTTTGDTLQGKGSDTRRLKLVFCVAEFRKNTG